MEKKIDIGSQVRIANDDSRAVYLVDGVVGCDFRLLDKAGGWSLMDRSSVVLADDQDDADPSDTPDDQFTGADLGAQMAAAEAEGFDHSQQVADRGQRVRLLATGLVGHVDEVSTSPAGWSYLVKLDDGGFAWKIGDEFELVA